MRILNVLTLVVTVVFIASCGGENAPDPVLQAGSPTPAPTTPTTPTPAVPVTKCNVLTDSCVLSISGTYADSFNTTHTISISSWVSSHTTFGSSTYDMLTIDSTEKRLIAKNNAANGYAPNKYSAFDWILVGSQLYYCQIAYDKNTQAEAEGVAKADGSNPTSGGCGGFPWSALN